MLRKGFVVTKTVKILEGIGVSCKLVFVATEIHLENALRKNKKSKG